MGENTSRFQILLLGAFVFFMVIGVLIFATFQSNSKKDSPTITTWGVLPASSMRPIFDSAEFLNSGVKVNYVEKNVATFDQEFVEALAEGRGPDLILIPQNLLYKEESKITPISYETFPNREFKDAFIEGSEVLLRNSGILGIPFVVDPLVLYWNRTNFSDAAITKPPLFWEEVGALVPKLTTRDENLNIRKSTIALGAYQNITNAKEILATLFLQSGNKITDLNLNGELISVLDSSVNKVDQALKFYTSFTDAANANYSWNRALPQSNRAFSDGTLSLYVGFGSELPTIRARNPNLNFDIAPLPQVKDGNKKSFANLYMFAIPKQSRYPLDSFYAAKTLSSATFLSIFVKNSTLAPTRRDLLSSTPSDAYRTIINQSALSAAVWEDPNPDRSGKVFQDLVESIISGEESVDSAIGVASSELGDLLNSGN